MITMTKDATKYDAIHARNFSDMHKDAYGFRPRGAIVEAWLAMSPWELDAEEARLQREIEISIEEDARAEAAAALRFEAHIGKLMADFSIDRADAIRWDIEACDLTEDIKFYGMSTYAYEHGLAYNYNFGC
jgi:hypothetical protein